MTWLRVNFKSGEELGFDPLSGGQSEESLFLSLRVNSYADVFVLDRPSCVGYIRHAHRFLRTLRPMSICRKKKKIKKEEKKVGLTAGTMKTLHTQKKKAKQKAG